MIFSIATLAGPFIDQLAQAPGLAPCPSAVPSSDWKWWMGALAPWVGPLLSGVVSIYVAWKVFHWQGEKDRKQWIRDQKKTEWSALLRGVANVFHVTNFTTSNGWDGTKANRIATELEEALEEISIACANCIFLEEFRRNKEGAKRIDEYLKSTKMLAQKLKGNLGLFEYIGDRVADAGIATDIDSKSIERNKEIVSCQISDLARQSRTLLDWLQAEAARNLGIAAEGEEH